jgi:acyl phosphate:glycerol-3-phosphate acyltransferase
MDTILSQLFSVPGLMAIAAGYLLGSIPFGLLLTKAAGLGDVRAIGSGNIGATNVLRTGHKGLAALTLLLDALKGTIAVLVGQYIVTALGASAIAGDAAAAPAGMIGGLIAGAGAFLGHIFPVWLGFKGGKGVATYIGVLLGVFWPSALFFCAAWLLVAFVTRYSSLSALVASVATPALLLFQDDKPEAMLAALMAALLIYKHRANIQRLMNGEEPKIGAKT